MHQSAHRRASIGLLAIALSAAALSDSVRGAGTVSLTALDVAYTQDFDTLASTGTSSLVPNGWDFVEAGSNANTLYTAGTGSLGTGDTYSFGSASSTERAFGGLRSGTLIPTIGASFTNNTGETITRLAISYTGEQWRLGTAGRNDRLDFQYSVNATSLTTGTYVDANVLDFTAPITTLPLGALVGNDAANRVTVSGTITGLAITNGSTFWVRWSDLDASGADDGLAIDNFSLTPSFVPTPTDPTGIGAANPAVTFAGRTTLLTVAVTPGQTPTSTGLAVSADLTAIGGGAAVAFFDDGTHGDVVAGNNTFSLATTFTAAVPAGVKSLPFTITDAENRSGSGTIALSVQSPPTTSIAISQIYGGGGNSGATLTNDFIELYNLGPTTVNLTGWSVQYTSAGGTSWQTTPLTGSIEPGTFYLVQEAAGAGGTTPLPTPNAIGGIAMSATSGKVALVTSTTALSGSCPVTPAIVDFVGYGNAASCFETSPTPDLNNTTAAIRKGDGATDTNHNLDDFLLGDPVPHNEDGFSPSGTGASNPPSALPAETARLTVTVTPGAHPPSTGLAVSADLSAIGGSATQALVDDGSGGDLTAGDGIFTVDVTVGGASTAGAKTLPATITDDQERTATANIRFTVEAPATAIHDIQGPGTASPLAGFFVTTGGVVTGVRTNGFFVQAPDVDADGSAMTSEGIFVFTGGPPATAAGNRVRVSGTVSEFVPPSDPFSRSLTEIGFGPAVRLLATGDPLPAPVPITAADTVPGNGLDQLERYEGMRVIVEVLRVVAPTAGSVNEQNATSTSTGVFFGVVDGVARPFREPGIDILNPLPAGSPCCVPRFDTNPERIRVDSDGLVGSPKIDVTTGAVLTGITGPLDYAFRAYTILPEAAPGPGISNLATATPAPAPTANEFTVAAYNLERFFDTANNGGSGAPVLTAAAFERRLNKASLAIRNILGAPDILAVEEVENVTTLEALAARINSDAVAALQPNPNYQAHLFEGNDVGGIDSGFLVKLARVSVVEVAQIGKDATYVDPSSNDPDLPLLNDRPPVLLRAEIAGPDGPFAVTVIVNHLRSLNGVDDPADGVRVRAKRAAQAEFLANLIQSRQAADPAERIVSVGDYNAFEFSDGLVDLIGTIKGTPTAADQVVHASPDLVTPDLVDLADLIGADQRYSYSFDGNAQVLDHAIVNQAALQRFSRIHYARLDADFPESYRNDGNRPERLSDHDPVIAYFKFHPAPTLTLNGANPMTVELGSTFVDPGATATDLDLGDISNLITVSGTVNTGAVGTYELLYSVSNGFETTTATRVVKVEDSTPPSVTAPTVSPASLGTPNHKLVDVTLGYSAFDASGGAVCSISAVSNEPENGTGDGDTGPDILVVDDHHLQLRAERAGTGNGRIYTITVVCADPSGNRTSRTATVTVPKDK